MKVKITPVACIVTKTRTVGKEELSNVELVTRFMVLKATTLVFPIPLLLPLLGTTSPKGGSAVSAARKILTARREASILVGHVVNMLVLSCIRGAMLPSPQSPLLLLLPLGTTSQMVASAAITARKILTARTVASIPVDHVENMLALSCIRGATLLSHMNKRRSLLPLRHLMKLKKRKQSLLSTMEVTDIPVACIVTKTRTAGKEALLNVEPATRFMALKATTLVFPNPLLLPLLGTTSPKEASAVSAARKTLIVKREDSTLVDHVVNTLAL
jgi:hypothetical protein